MSKRYSYQIGKTAFKLLTPGASGRVLAAFSEAAFLVTKQSELFWLASANAPGHSRGMRIAGPFPKLEAGGAFFVEGQCIRISPDYNVDFGDASTWTRPRIPAGTALNFEKIPLRVKSHFLNRFNLSQASGFGRLIPNILSLVTDQGHAETVTDYFLSFAWPGIHDITQACLLRDSPGLFKKAEALVGLGEGLTPSGDDFLGGLLFCIYTLKRLYPGLIDFDSSEQASFIESAGKRTHQISFTLLQDSINGRAVEPLHELIHAILSDRPLESLRPASRLTRIGHSTGWDLLTGALTGLLMTFRSPDTKDSPPVSPSEDLDV